MKLTNLKKASDYDVEKWLEKELDLTPYQKDKMKRDELVRFSPFEFYQDKDKEKVSPLWRLTIFFVPFYYIFIVGFLPLNMIFTGKWGYSQKFYDNFHGVWMKKLNL